MGVLHDDHRSSEVEDRLRSSGGIGTELSGERGSARLRAAPVTPSFL
ncbi:hypothetical protein [Rathayibacter sp. VKM Ac-2801]|nr:hypothetical protein [Rathayibacter sp. VKM Ac-2801]QHC69283.1 hypothetical protein GSU45_02050 [Rathayibacter sp. VKM Ac-2801]